MIELSSRTHVSCGAPRLVTIGGRSITVAGWTGAAPADDSAALSERGDGPGRYASKAAPAPAPRKTTIANSTNTPRLGDPFAAPWGTADSDMSASARMA